MAGSVLLCGGNEFERESTPLNQAALHLIRRKPPRVVVLPVATDNQRKVSRAGINYFSALNASVEASMIADKAAAQDPVISASFESTDMVYITDGNPLALVETLEGTEALKKLAHYWQAGLILAASGAAAMALCDLYWDSGTWEKGLGVLKGVAVMPHYEYVIGRFSPARLRESLPPEYTLLGLDDSTGVLVIGKEARIIGPNMVTVYRADLLELDYEDATSFMLDMPLG